MNVQEIVMLGERVEQAREAHRIAHEARRVAFEAFRAAEKAADAAWMDFAAAQNALIVAAGGDDRSFALGLQTTG